MKNALQNVRVAVCLSLVAVLIGCEGQDGAGPMAVGPVTYFLHRDDRVLSELPPAEETTSSALVLAGLGPAEWTVTLSAGFVGSHFSYSVWVYAYKTTFRLDILLEKHDSTITLATWEGLTTTDPSMLRQTQISGSASGTEVVAYAGDRLIVRVTATGQQNSGVTIGASASRPSNITIAP